MDSCSSGFLNRLEFARRSSGAQNTAFRNWSGSEAHDEQSTTSVQSSRSGPAHEADDGLVYRSQLCRYRAQKQALCRCRGQLCRPSPAVMAREGLLLLVRGRSLCRAGDIDRPDPISLVDKAATRSHTKCLAGHPGLSMIIGSSFSGIMDQESLS